METAAVELEIGTVVADPTAPAIARNLALIDRYLATLIADIAVYDNSMMWAVEGYPSTVAWVCENGRRSRGEATRLVKTARRLQSLPHTAAAFLDGTLSYSQVGAMLANITDATADLFARNEETMVAALADLNVTDTANVMREWATRAKASIGDDGPMPEPERDHLHFSPMLDNSWKLDGLLTGEKAEAVKAALDACLPEVVPDEPTQTLSQRYADALVELAHRALQNVPTTGRRSADVTLLITFQDYVSGGIARYADGTVVAPNRVKQLLCDAVLTPLITGESGQPLWLGRSARTASNAQWRALVARDRCCAFPGCHTKAQWCEAHHVKEYDRDTGPTDVDNMALLCSRHHHLVHSVGWSARMLENQTLEVRDPYGRRINAPPPSDLFRRIAA
jgi:Domain of unknown function (DUF222)